MLKKLLIGVGILAVIGVAGFLFLGNKISTFIADKEPEFRQYLSMTREEQNAYVEKNFNEFMQMIMNHSEEQAKAAYEQIKDNPEVRAAAVEFGRSIVAGFIMASEPIVKDMAEDLKAQIESEVNAVQSRGDNYRALLNKYGISNQ